MFNDLNYSFKYFCVIYSRSLIYLSRSNPCSRLCAMFITYTWKCTTFLFDCVLFYLTASCKEMYLGLCDKRCSHDFIRLVFFFQFFFKLSCRNWVQHLHWIYEFIYIDCKDYVFHQLKTFICFMDKRYFFLTIFILQSVRILPCSKVRKREFTVICVLNWLKMRCALLNYREDYMSIQTWLENAP